MNSLFETKPIPGKEEIEVYQISHACQFIICYVFYKAEKYKIEFISFVFLFNVHKFFCQQALIHSICTRSSVGSWHFKQKKERNNVKHNLI